MNPNSTCVHLKQTAFELRPIGMKIGQYVLYDIYPNPKTSRFNEFPTFTEIWVYAKRNTITTNYAEIEKSVESITLDFKE